MKKTVTVIHLIDWTIFKCPYEVLRKELSERFFSFADTEWFDLTIPTDKILYLVQDYETEPNNA